MAAAVLGLNLNKAYTVGGERVHALNDVSLEVYPGEMIGVVGRTESGKSTLMHVLETRTETPYWEEGFGQ